MRLKLNKKEIIDVAIASLSVKNAPKILGSFVPSSLTTGTTGNLLGGAFTYLLGMLLKKPTVSSVGLALAVTNVIQDVAVEPAINMVAPTNTAPLKSLSNYTRLMDYPKQLKTNKNYHVSYGY